MLKNYFKVAFRYLLKNKLNSFINVFGLSTAIAFCIVAYLNHDYTVSFDMFHQNAGEIFRLKSIRMQNERERVWGYTPRPLGPALARDFPAIKRAVRLTPASVVFKSGDKIFNERVLHVDPNFFEMFAFPLQHGDMNVLHDKNRIVLSEATATKYFGDTNPIGQQITMRYRNGELRSFFVGAVARKIPDNSSIQFDVLAALELLVEVGIDKPESWGDWAYVTFVQSSDPTQMTMLASKLERYLSAHNAAVGPEWQVTRYHIEPLQGMAMKARDVRADILKQAMHPAGMLSPSIIAALLLLMACFNYINTAIASSSQRLKEIGIRKVVGGFRTQLIWQFLGENLLLCAIALGLGIALAEVFVPAYDQLWTYFELTLDYSQNRGLLLFLAGLLFFLGLVAGTYPAFYISAFHPVTIMRGAQKFGGTSWLSRTLLTFQFTISILTVIASIVFMQNAGFLREMDWGYNKDTTIIVPLRDAKYFEPYKNEIRRNANIVNVAGAMSHIGFNWGNAVVTSAAQKLETTLFSVGYNYVETMQMRLAQGRTFEENQSADLHNAVVVNQKFVEEMGWSAPLGQIVSLDTLRYSVIGVVENFHNDGVWRPITPCLLRLAPPENIRTIAVRANAENLQAANEFLRTTWQRIVPDLPYEGYYQDRVMAEALEVSNNIKTMFIYIAVLAIAIAAMGLFALVALNIAKRTKEIGIRKVLGASVTHILHLVNKEFALLLLASTTLASLAGYFIVRALIESIYAYHVGFSTFPFLLSGAIVFVIAAMTVGSQVLKVATANPVEALRYE